MPSRLSWGSTSRTRRTRRRSPACSRRGSKTGCSWSSTVWTIVAEHAPSSKSGRRPMLDLLHSWFGRLLRSATPHTPNRGGGGAAGALHLRHLAPLHLFKWSNTAGDWKLTRWKRDGAPDQPPDFSPRARQPEFASPEGLAHLTTAAVGRRALRRGLGRSSSGPRLGLR